MLYSFYTNYNTNTNKLRNIYLAANASIIRNPNKLYLTSAGGQGTLASHPSLITDFNIAKLFILLQTTAGQ